MDALIAPGLKLCIKQQLPGLCVENKYYRNKFNKAYFMDGGEVGMNAPSQSVAGWCAFHAEQRQVKPYECCQVDLRKIEDQMFKFFLAMGSKWELPGKKDKFTSSSKTSKPLLAVVCCRCLGLLSNADGWPGSCETPTEYFEMRARKLNYQQRKARSVQYIQAATPHFAPIASLLIPARGGWRLNA